MLVKEKDFDLEVEKYINEGWIKAEISLIARDDEKAFKFFEDVSGGLETEYIKPIKISYNKIEEKPFLGVISINFLALDFRTLANIIMQFAPVEFEVKKESIELSLEDLNTILLDVSDMVKTYNFLAEKPVVQDITHTPGDYPESKINAVLCFESNGETKEEVEKSINALLGSLKSEKEISISSEEVDEVAGEETEEETVYFGNFEVELNATILGMIDVIAKYNPSSIEMTGPEEITLSSAEIYGLLVKLLIISQKYSEKIMRKAAAEKKLDSIGST